MPPRAPFQPVRAISIAAGASLLLAASASARAQPAARASGAAAPAQERQPAPPLPVPPVPDVPGAHPLPEPDPVRDAALDAARRAEADASPRRSVSAPHHGPALGPPVPAAPVRRRYQIHLTPVEAGIADRNAMSESMRVMPYEMRQPSGFTTLYAVDARPDMMVRGNGAVYAVFPQGDYALATVKKRKVVQTLVPAGTVYYIGEPDWRNIWLPGIRGMRPRFRPETPEEVAAHTPPATALERVEPLMPADLDGVYVSPIALHELDGFAPLQTRIETRIEPAARAFDRPPPQVPPRTGPAPEPSAATGGAAAGGAKSVDPDDDRAEPPIVSDRIYRMQRLQQLMERAAKQGAAR